MNYFLVNYFLVNYFLVQTDRQTESDAYEPTVQVAQVGSMNSVTLLHELPALSSFLMKKYQGLVLF